MASLCARKPKHTSSATATANQFPLISGKTFSAKTQVAFARVTPNSLPLLFRRVSLAGSCLMTRRKWHQVCYLFDQNGFVYFILLLFSSLSFLGPPNTRSLFQSPPLLLESIPSHPIPFCTFSLARSLVCLFVFVCGESLIA